MPDLVIIDAGDDVSKEAIEVGCIAAEQLIESRGFTVAAAYEAALARANDESFNKRAAKAWDDAEDAAFKAALGHIDDWPEAAVLGYE